VSLELKTACMMDAMMHHLDFACTRRYAVSQSSTLDRR
jgi:hypothetical protein